MKRTKVDQHVLRLKVSVNIAKVMKLLDPVYHHLKYFIQIPGVSVFFQVMSKVHFILQKLKRYMVSSKKYSL